MNASTIKKFTAIFQALLAKQNALDCEWAEKASDLVANLNGVADDAMTFFVSQVGMTVGRARALLELAVLWTAIPDAKAWNTLGVDGVRLLAKVSTEAKRKKVMQETARLVVASGAKATGYKHVLDAVKKVEPKALEKLIADRPARRAPSTREHPAQALDRITVRLREACASDATLLAKLKKACPDVVEELKLAQPLEAVA